MLAYGSHHGAIQQCAALYYAGPEKLEPMFEGLDEELEADADEGDGGDEEEEDEEEEGEEGELPELQLDCTRHLVTSYSSSRGACTWYGRAAANKAAGVGSAEWATGMGMVETRQGQKGRPGSHGPWDGGGDGGHGGYGFGGGDPISAW